ncbi:MAG: hypothetical protein AAFV53_26620, partial [Myxococcota bacterium]
FIRGVNIDAFIRNGQNFFTELAIYADGSFNCWGGVDRAFLHKKFQQGWIRSSVPDGETISAHQIGAFTVEDGQWTRSPAQLHQHMLQLLDALNPEHTDLIDFEGSDVIIRNNVRYAKLGMMRAHPVRTMDDRSPVRGVRRVLFSKHDDQWWLGPIGLYADRMADIHPHPAHQHLISVDEFFERVHGGTISSTVPDGARLNICDLGTITVRDAQFWVEPDSLIKELRDAVNQLCGEESVDHRFYRIWKAYLLDPTPNGRQQVRDAYEAVPRHRRMYLGDMDTRDRLICAIISTDQEPSAALLSDARDGYRYLLS